MADPTPSCGAGTSTTAGVEHERGEPMTTCQQCGSRDENGRFCTSCGGTLTTASMPPPPPAAGPVPRTSGFGRTQLLVVGLAVLLVASGVTAAVALTGSSGEAGTPSAIAASMPVGAGDTAGSAAPGGRTPAGTATATGPTATGTTAGTAAAAPALGSVVPQNVVQIGTDGKGNTAPAGNGPANPAGTGRATCAAGTSIAVAGALSGANAALGRNILNGAQLAIDQHNQNNPNCQIGIRQFDTAGDPNQAAAVAPQIVADTGVIGLVGPAFSGETKAAGPFFNQAGLLSMTPSATNPSLTEQGWTNFFRGLANDDAQGPALAAYMVNTLGYRKVCVIQDDGSYGTSLGAQVGLGLGSAADASCTSTITSGDKSFTAPVQSVVRASPDAVFFAGYYPEAAALVQQLREAGVTARFVAGDGVYDPQFRAQAGAAALGALVSCPCGPTPDDFATVYTASFGVAPGVYSTEGYDLATIMLSGIDSGVADRAGLVEYVKRYDGQGVAHHYRWDSTGELESPRIWTYTVS